MSLKEIRMPEGVKDIDELVRSGATVPEPTPIGVIPAPTPLEKLKSMSATKRLDEMEEILKNSTYVFADMAISGMTTLFYSWPNGGKTLMATRFLTDAISAGRIKAEDVFYINADDNYSGLYHKGLIAKQWGYSMVSPAQNNMTPDDVMETMMSIAASGEAEGKVFVLDTLKKFADMMNKGAQSRLYQALRELNAKNATVILLGHANKHLDNEDNLVYEGTSDTLNDVDVAYAIYTLTDKSDERQIVEFRNTKDRGSVIAKVGYTYTKTQDISYTAMLASVEQLDARDAKEAGEVRRINDLREKYASVMHFVKAVLAGGAKNESQIIAIHKKGEIETAGEVTRNALTNGLKALSGHEWDMARSPSQKNAKVYSLRGSLASQYQVGKNDEF